MSTELIVKVHLDWTAKHHWDPESSLPCRLGDGPTKSRDSSGLPCHKHCAEDEIARELYGRGQLLIADEPFPTPALREPTAGGIR